MKPEQKDGFVLEYYKKDGDYVGLVILTLHGHRCGYVGVPKSHAWYGKCYNDIKCEVHGGLTYSSRDMIAGYKKKDLWFVGFDCNHSGDAPDHSAQRRYIEEDVYPKHIAVEIAERHRLYEGDYIPGFNVIRGLNYVIQEVENLLKQAKGVSENGKFTKKH